MIKRALLKKVLLLSSMNLMTVLSSSGSRLIVHLPESLRQVSPNGFTHEEAMFGKRLHGTSIVHALYYADSDFCDPQAADQIKFYPMSPMALSLPFLLMINRGGGCNFVRKVRNAQHMGAAGVIFADNVCRCADQACLNETQGEGLPCEKRAPIMPNDGSGGHDIIIPSFLLWKRDAMLFKKTMIEGNQTIRVEMQFPPLAESARRPGLEEPSTVSLELWMSLTDSVSMDLITRFQPAALAFQEHLDFTLHPYVVDGEKIECLSDNAIEETCFQLCTNQGRYCAFPPETNNSPGISGADVVRESLRQLCIWSQSNTSWWWVYIKAFYENCLATVRFNDEKCVEQAYEQVGIQSNVINSCITDSGGLQRQGRNNKLETELEIQRENSISALPTLYINGAPHDGPITADAVFRVVCNQFRYSKLSIDSNERRLCSRCGSLECTDFSGCVASNGTCPDWHLREAAAAQNPRSTGNGGGLSVTTFVSAVFLLVALTVGIAGLIYRRSQVELRQQVRAILFDYVLLDNTEANEEGDIQAVELGKESPTSEGMPNHTTTSESCSNGDNL